MSTRFVHQSERREFVKIQTDIPIRYKFLSKVLDLGEDQIFEGTTADLSAGGCLLHGKVPDLNWIAPLLMGKIHMGINLLLPSVDTPIKAIGRVRWVEAFEPGNDRLYLGLGFNDIRKESQDLIMKYLIRAQMTK
ncbi:MAG: PilZ domain-containing protein [Planctomycetota bacterium]